MLLTARVTSDQSHKIDGKHCVHGLPLKLGRTETTGHFYPDLLIFARGNGGNELLKFVFAGQFGLRSSAQPLWARRLPPMYLRAPSLLFHELPSPSTSLAQKKWGIHTFDAAAEPRFTAARLTPWPLYFIPA